MSRGSQLRAAFAGLGLSAALAACATAPADDPGAAPAVTAPAPAAPTFTATPGLSSRERLRKAVELLGMGSEGQARAELQALLSEQPNHAAARSLAEQIEQDPKTLLGERSFPYKVRPGETLSELAGRFLGDPMKFYALARYNGISAPANMEVGQALLIPGVAPRTPAPAARKSAAPAAPGATVASVARNPARAAQLRRSGLDSLNRGAVDSAVNLFRQALSLDPGNALIQGDLDRALRILSSVRGR